MVVLVEERLEYDNFFTRFNEAHECAEHSLIRAGGNDDLGVWIDVAAEQGRIGFGDCFL